HPKVAPIVLYSVEGGQCRCPCYDTPRFVVTGGEFDGVEVGRRPDECAGQDHVAPPGSDLDLEGMSRPEDGRPEIDRVAHPLAQARNSSSQRFTSAGCSWCTKWPASGT